MGYLVVQGVVVWEGVPWVGGQVGGQEEDQGGGLGAGREEDQEAGGEASDPSFLQGYREASGREEHLVVVLVGGQTGDQGASWEGLGEDPWVGARSSEGPAGVEVPAVPQLEGGVED